MLRIFIYSILLVVASVSSAAVDAAQEVTLLGNLRQLVYEGVRSGEGYFSSDGNSLVFQSEREEGNPFYQIYLMDLKTGDTHRVSPGVGKTTCAFFQNENGRLIFASTHEDVESKAKQKTELEFRASGKQRRYAWDYDSSMEIYSANRDGTGLVNLTKSPGYDAEGSFSPDGKEIVFCSLRSAFQMEQMKAEEKARFEKDPAWWGEIYVMNEDGSNVRQLTNSPGYDGGPFFSPDGERIVWRHFDESGMIADVWTMKKDGSDKRRITDFKCMSWAPYFHPSGKYIIFTANKAGFENFELFMVDAEGKGAPVQVTFSDGFDGLPVFSPDGKMLCWSSNRTTEKRSQLFLADWDHEEALKLLAGGTAASASSEAAVASKTTTGFQSAISQGDLKQQIEWLADDAQGGRGTGSDGALASAQWAADYFRDAGVKSLPGSDGYFQAFEYGAGEKIVADKTSASVNGDALKLETDFRPLAFSENGSVEGEVVFAGYGLNVPEGTDQQSYNSYEGLDVKDKIVLFLRYVPEAVDPARRAHLNRYAGLRYKVMMARERGAKAAIVVTGPNSPNAGELLPLNNDGTNAGSGLPAMSISADAASKLLAASGKSLKQLQEELDQENPHAPKGFVLSECKVKLEAEIEHIKGSDRNVIACVPGATDEWVVVGAHYDHLGVGKGNNSLARADEDGKVHPGADDNASGTAVVLEMAAALAAQKQPPKRGVIFALWSGEEMGLIGSHAFIEKPPVPLEKIVAYVNFDMVGRLRDNRLIVQAIGSSKSWARILEKRNVAAGFQLNLQEDPYLPTDVTSFYPKKIPVLNFFTGAHDDYHRPTDTADKINVPGVERIAKFALGIVEEIATADKPEFSRIVRKEEKGGGRDTMRAYLGTIPDYAVEVKGVKISGVREGSPAQKAGLQGGDVIIEFGAQKIKNIYDYTYALDAVKIGQTVPLIVMRGEKRLELSVTPEARK